MLTGRRRRFLMQIKTSKHAQVRLKERFKEPLSFGGALDENCLKYISSVRNKRAKVYKYIIKNNPMYLLIGDRPPTTVITVFTPKLYKNWERRFQVITNIKI